MRLHAEHSAVRGTAKHPLDALINTAFTKMHSKKIPICGHEGYQRGMSVGRNMAPALSDICLSWIKIQVLHFKAKQMSGHNYSTNHHTCTLQPPFVESSGNVRQNCHANLKHESHSERKKKVIAPYKGSFSSGKLLIYFFFVHENICCGTH